MMKGKKTFGWSSEGNLAFEDIKKSIANTPTLECPDFSRDFIIYLYATENTLAAVLTQKNA